MATFDYLCIGGGIFAVFCEGFVLRRLVDIMVSG